MYYKNYARCPECWRLMNEITKMSEKYGDLHRHYQNGLAELKAHYKSCNVFREHLERISKNEQND